MRLYWYYIFLYIIILYDNVFFYLILYYIIIFSILYYILFYYFKLYNLLFVDARSQLRSQGGYDELAACQAIPSGHAHSMFLFPIYKVPDTEKYLRGFYFHYMNTLRSLRVASDIPLKASCLASTVQKSRSPTV